MASLVLSGNTSGSITISSPSVSGTNTLTLPASTGTFALTAAPTFTGQATIPTINLTGGQITFPATQSASANANTLDDYEEGTWTPVLQGGSTNPTISYGSQLGRYTKIGNMVNFVLFINVSSISGGSGNAQITLPFSALNGGGLDYTPISPWSAELNWGGVQFAPLVWQNTNYISLTGITDNAYYSQTAINGTMAGGTEIRLSGTYITA
jgi:hypothetical protein